MTKSIFKTKYENLNKFEKRISKHSFTPPLRVVDLSLRGEYYFFRLNKLVKNDSLINIKYFHGPDSPPFFASNHIHAMTLTKNEKKYRLYIRVMA